MQINASWTRAVLRRGSAATALAATGLWLSGCMSSGGDASLFGFTPGAAMQEIAGDPTLTTPGTAPEIDVAAEATTPVEAGETAGTVEEVAAIAPPPVAPASDAAAAQASGTLSMVAFAAPNPPAPSASGSLYERLFAESEARTPVRNTESGRSGRVVVTRTDGVGKPPSDAALPGVDPSSLFEIGQRASVDDPDFLEDIGGSYQTASLSGMARLAPSGFLVQRDDIVTNCFDTGLVNLLTQIERRFGEKVVITSGYRSPSHNRRVNGAKASMHMACKAADLHVPGVSGATVAAFVRGLPNRGGVGTYCHTAAVHVDVGRKRDWNWACRRRQG